MRLKYRTSILVIVTSFLVVVTARPQFADNQQATTSNIQNSIAIGPAPVSTPASAVNDVLTPVVDASTTEGTIINTGAQTNAADFTSNTNPGRVTTKVVASLPGSAEATAAASAALGHPVKVVKVIKKIVRAGEGDPQVGVTANVPTQMNAPLTSGGVAMESIPTPPMASSAPIGATAAGSATGVTIGNLDATASNVQTNAASTGSKVDPIVGLGGADRTPATDGAAGVVTSVAGMNSNSSALVTGTVNPPSTAGGSRAANATYSSLQTTAAPQEGSRGKLLSKFT